MSSTPAFASTVRHESVSISTANTNRDGTGTIGTVLTAGSSGTRISRVNVKAVGTTTAGIVRIYIYNGSTAILLTEVAVSAITPSGTVTAFESVLSESGNPTLMPIILKSGESLRASTHNAESFVVHATGGDF